MKFNKIMEKLKARPYKIVSICIRKKIDDVILLNCSVIKNVFRLF